MTQTPHPPLLTLPDKPPPFSLGGRPLPRLDATVQFEVLGGRIIEMNGPYRWRLWLALEEILTLPDRIMRTTSLFSSYTMKDGETEMRGMAQTAGSSVRERFEELQSLDLSPRDGRIPDILSQIRSDIRTLLAVTQQTRTGRFADFTVAHSFRSIMPSVVAWNYLTHSIPSENV